ncbi:3-phytase [Sphingomonas spermidinifaciens]|uniref:3-phytase n=1 Tax=Sphingomonas spermidinifaciens TaxID=1141889 RepID=A0A2A4B5T0_9SPHN|nr:3-phytase [Sphingomonas spermidinifaciens]
MRALLPAMVLAGCATLPPAPTTLAENVTARGETEPVGTAAADAADDPAIWRNAANPEASLIIATDKKSGLWVYGLDGRRRDFVQAGRVNNVDLREHGGRIVVAASDRTDMANAKLALFTLDGATGKLMPAGTRAAGAGEAYGLCLGIVEAKLYAFVVLKDGTIRQIDPADGAVVRTMKLATQSEGCVVDDRTATLFVAEEDVGIWRFDARPGGNTTPVPVAKVDGRTLVADVEGLAIAANGADGGWLVASSQGDNAYQLFRLPDLSPAGRFRVVAGRYGATSETDGIEVTLGNVGPAFPGGLMVVQDGDNAPAAQNFKLLAWDDVKAALGL